MADGKKIEGFAFLCRLFAAMSRDPIVRKMLHNCADKAKGLEKDDALDLASNWLDNFLPPIQDKLDTRRESSARYLQRILQGVWGKSAAGNKHCNSVPSKYNAADMSKQSEAEWNNYRQISRRPLVAMFHEQTGSSQPFLEFLAISIALSLGRHDRNFCLEKEAVREILQLCLRKLELPLGYAIPEDFEVRTEDEDGGVTKLQEYVAVCLYQTLYALYPQRMLNLASGLEKSAKIFVEKYCVTESQELPGELVYTLVERNEDVKNLRKEWVVAYENVRKYKSEHFKGNVEEIYEMPLFVPASGHADTGILHRDEHAVMRRFVYSGEEGKSTFLQVVALCCMAQHPFFFGQMQGDMEAFDAIAAKLSLDASAYFPLALDCRKADRQSTDPIAEAVRQLCEKLDPNDRYRYAGGVNPKNLLVKQICFQQLKEGRLLLLVDHWDQAPMGLREAIYGADNRCHILIAASKCRQSEMRKMPGFSFWKIQGFSRDSKLRFVSKVSKQPEYYCGLLKSNRCLELFADTPARLLQVVTDADQQWDAMIRLEISRQMECLDIPVDDVNYDVEQFFSQLALGSLEGLWQEPSRGASDADFYRGPDVIPGNLMRNALYHKGIFTNREWATQIWEQACGQQILVCAADAPMGFRFKNQIFRYSLAADAYWNSLQAGPEIGESTIARMCRLSPYHFSFVVVLLVNRICGIGVDAQGDCSDKNMDLLYRLCQGIAGYVLSLTEMEEAVHCCQALADILGGQYARNMLSACMNPDAFFSKRSVCQSRQILLRSYAYLFNATYQHHGALELPEPVRFIRTDQEIAWFRQYYPQALVSRIA